MKDESGFSLLEVVLSIAVLTLISGFILQMFMASVYLNQKAFNLDMGANTAAHELEILKGGNTLINQAVTKYYDSQWSQIVVGQPETERYTPNVNLILPESVKFILTISASEDGVYESEVFKTFDSGGNYVIGSDLSKLYRLDAAVYELKESSEQEQIVSLSTRKYLQSG